MGERLEQPMCRDFSRKQIFLLLRHQLFPFTSQLFLVNRAFLFATRVSLLPKQHLAAAGSKWKTAPRPKLASDNILVWGDKAFWYYIVHNCENDLVYIKYTMNFRSSMGYVKKWEKQKQLAYLPDRDVFNVLQVLYFLSHVVKVHWCFQNRR